MRSPKCPRQGARLAPTSKNIIFTPACISFFISVILATNTKLFLYSLELMYQVQIQHIFISRGRYLSIQNYGSGTGRILLDNVTCAGNEEHITECGHNGWGNFSCSMSSAVGVNCGPTSM